MENATILLAEDNADDEALTLRAFKKGDIRGNIFVARDGVEALDYLFCRNTHNDRDPSNLPQLILLDIKMPKLDGLEVLRQLRASPTTHLLPAVLLTSSREEKDLIEGYESGANSYIVKPVDFSQFVESIRELGLYWLTLNQIPPR